MISTYGSYSIGRHARNRFSPEGPINSSEFTSPSKAHYLIVLYFTQKDSKAPKVFSSPTTNDARPHQKIKI